jgi:peptidoglycan-N-acetylglucosamine deacetylase
LSQLYLRIIRKILCTQLVKQVNYSAKGANKSKSIFLTFDDGPHKIHTPAILNLLKIYQIKATFFVVGRSLRENMDIGRRIVDEGHLLGGHTYSHKVLPKMTKKELSSEILNCQELISELQKGAIRIFRPPCGLIGIRDFLFLYKHRIVPCLWTIDSNDSRNPPYEVIISRMQRLVKSNSVLLFHDDSNLCVEALSVLLPVWIAKGYEFCHL